MSGATCCNCRAGFFLIVLSLVLIVGIVPAFGQSAWYDSAGVTEDYFGNSLTVVPDMNGDGFDEFVVGVAGSDTTGLDAGQVFFWYGGDRVTRAPDHIWNGISPELLGWAVADIGDVDDDGTPDFAVGGPWYNGAGAAIGRVFVFFGGASLSAAPDLIITGAVGGDQFGFAISAAGDFDRDGIDDFIVGAPFDDTGGLDAGAAYVIYGAPGGPSADLADATRLTGEIAGDNFGWSVADAGDFLGGPADCVAVGAPLNNTHGGLSAGAIYVYEGDATPDALVDWETGIGAEAAPGSQFGFCVRNAGNLDGDAYDDLAVGAPFCSENGIDAGRVEFFYGDPSPSLTAGHAVDGQTRGAFGWSLDRIGDVSGTSREDVLIGAPLLSLEASNAGRAYVYEGGSNATNAGNLTILLNDPINPGNAAEDQYGYAVSSAGDFDGDGQPDFAVAAPLGNIGSTNAPAGFVILHHSTGGPVPALMRIWRAHWQTSDRVALEFAFSLPPERFVDVRLVRRSLDDAGAVQATTTVWSGRPVVGDSGEVGVLARTADGFLFRDAAPVASGAEFDYALTAWTDDGQDLRLESLAGPGTRPDLPPVALALQPLWPNPANPAVRIRYRAPAGAATEVLVLDVRGRVVRHLHQAAGSGDWQELTWRGDTDAGRAAPSGVYLVRVSTGAELQTGRVVLAR